MKLYQLPERQNIKLYIDNQVIIFDHLDGVYSYCWLEDTKDIVHIKNSINLEKYKDGYKIKGVISNRNIGSDNNE